MLRGPYNEETCPHCYHVLIELARFDARDDAVPLDRAGWSGGGRAWWEIDPEWEFSGRLWDRIKAAVYQRRLTRVLRQYPRSLYCSGCGYILKRR